MNSCFSVNFVGKANNLGIDFSHPVELENYECKLDDYSIPYSFYNFPKQIVGFTDEKNMHTEYVLESCNIQNFKDVISCFSKAGITEEMIMLDQTNTGHTEVKVRPKCKATLSTKLSEILGYDSHTILESHTVSSAPFRIHQPKYILLLFNILEYQYLNNKMLPLLHIISVKPTPMLSVSHNTDRNTFPLSNRNCTYMKISITDENGDELTFHEDTSAFVKITFIPR